MKAKQSRMCAAYEKKDSLQVRYICLCVFHGKQRKFWHAWTFERDLDKMGHLLDPA